MSELVISAQDARNLTDKIKAGTAAVQGQLTEAMANRREQVGDSAPSTWDV